MSCLCEKEFFYAQHHNWTISHWPGWQLCDGRIWRQHIPGARVTQVCTQNTLWVIYLKIVSFKNNYSKFVISVCCDEKYWYFMHSRLKQLASRDFSSSCSYLFFFFSGEDKKEWNSRKSHQINMPFICFLFACLFLSLPSVPQFFQLPVFVSLGQLLNLSELSSVQSCSPWEQWFSAAGSVLSPGGV